MTEAQALDRISIDPAICGGKPCIRGHRIWVALVLGMLAEGLAVADILEQYPQLEEAHALGLELADLIAADIGTARMPTVSAYIETIAPTFTSATAAYRPYWHLAAIRLGDRRLAEVTVQDLSAVVDDAVSRAQRNRPECTGRASRESCVAALRALFRRAAAGGLVTANAAAGLTKPRRARSRRRALDDHELAELIDAVRTTSHDPSLDLLLMRFHLESGA